MNNLNYGYAPGLALQVSGVNNFFASRLACVFLLLSRLRLLEATSSWTASFVVSTRIKYAMQQLEPSAMHECL